MGISLVQGSISRLTHDVSRWLKRVRLTIQLVHSTRVRELVLPDWEGKWQVKAGYLFHYNFLLFYPSVSLTVRSS